jgi:hypothetical protein
VWEATEMPVGHSVESDDRFLSFSRRVSKLLLGTNKEYDICGYYLSSKRAAFQITDVYEALISLCTYLRKESSAFI